MFHVSCLESAGFTHHKLSQIRCLFGKSCSFNPFDLPAWFVLILGSIQEMEGPKAPQSWHIFTLQINWHSKPTGEMMDLSLNECEKVYHSYSRFVDAYLPKVIWTYGKQNQHVHGIFAQARWGNKSHGFGFWVVFCRWVKFGAVKSPWSFSTKRLSSSTGQGGGGKIYGCSRGRRFERKILFHWRMMVIWFGRSVWCWIVVQKIEDVWKPSFLLLTLVLIGNNLFVQCRIAMCFWSCSMFFYPELVWSVSVMSSILPTAIPGANPVNCDCCCWLGCILEDESNITLMLQKIRFFKWSILLEHVSMKDYVA